MFTFEYLLTGGCRAHYFKDGKSVSGLYMGFNRWQIKTALRTKMAQTE